MKVDFFHSRTVAWPGRRVQCKKSVWHSCMQWGWESLRRGEHPIEWYEYITLSIRIGTRGACWQFHPRKPSEGLRRHRLGAPDDAPKPSAVPLTAEEIAEHTEHPCQRPRCRSYPSGLHITW